MARISDFHQMLQLIIERGFHGQERFGGNFKKTFFSFVTDDSGK